MSWRKNWDPFLSFSKFWPPIQLQCLLKKCQNGNWRSLFSFMHFKLIDFWYLNLSCTDQRHFWRFVSWQKMEFSKLEQEAERKAASHVANMLHTPDKLEKVSYLNLTFFCYNFNWSFLPDQRVVTIYLYQYRWVKTTVIRQTGAPDEVECVSQEGKRGGDAKNCDAESAGWS